MYFFDFPLFFSLIFLWHYNRKDSSFMTCVVNCPYWKNMKTFSISRCMQKSSNWSVFHFWPTRFVVLLNSSNIVSILFSDELYLSLFGIMECISCFLWAHSVDNKDLATKGNFREFFKTKVMYKKVLDIKDQHILDLIHQNYRISYYRVCFIVITVSSLECH